MADCSICYEAVIDHPAPEGQEATGSHRSSCGHVFHPKCITKWHKSNSRSTCPLCRKCATELEDCAPKPEAAVASVTSEQRQREIVSQLANLSAEFASLLGPVADAAPAPALADPSLMEEGGWIRISRANFEQVIFNQGGPVGAWVAAAAEEVAFDEYDEAEVCRHEFERILRETGARVFSDAEWEHLMAIYPFFSVAFYNRTANARDAASLSTTA